MWHMQLGYTHPNIIFENSHTGRKKEAKIPAQTDKHASHAKCIVKSMHAWWAGVEDNLNYFLLADFSAGFCELFYS